MITTKAAILVDLNEPLVVADIKVPAPTYGQVLVQVHYSGICGAQINEIEGAKGPDRFLPHLLGHEGSATVLEVGPGVKTVKEGDHCVMHWRPSDGIQSEPPKYDWDGRTVNAGWVTSFNQHALISENRLTPIPTDFDRRLAPLFGCAITTAMGVVNNDARLKVGQSVVIMGLGGVGLSIAQAADMVSAHPIIGVDRVPEKLAMAERFGMTQGFCADDKTDLRAEILKIVGDKGADVVIETTGNGRVIELAYDLTHADGSTILVGVPRKTDPITIYSLPLHFNKILTGSHGGDAVPHVEIPRYVRLCEAGKLKLDGLVTDEFELEHINDAIGLVRSGGSGRVLVNMGS
ncbi:MAG: zinc-binding dehydrogenase [Gemmatimonadetes bacterium]|jgi:S-(hydroxymethyl)glutathione dehydrogenase / alcohol dehydrogenase|nr:zinc-binding dehydrogenase [Gemmatimonadota bacterium]